MFIIRRMISVASSGGSFEIPTFTGGSAIFHGTEEQGYVEIISSGTITFPTKGKVDVFMVGGGKAGTVGSYTNPSTATSGTGGLAGATLTFLNKELEGSYSISIASAAGNTTFETLGTTSSTGIGTPGAGRSTTGAGNAGGRGVYPFDDESFTRLAGPGGGGALQLGGSAFGRNGGAAYDGGGTGGAVVAQAYKGAKGNDGSANTGGGGGGASNYTGNGNTQGGSSKGGSGIVIIRWGYNVA